LTFVAASDRVKPEEALARLRGMSCARVEAMKTTTFVRAFGITALIYSCSDASELAASDPGGPGGGVGSDGGTNATDGGGETSDPSRDGGGPSDPSKDGGVVTGDAGPTVLGQPGVWENVTPAGINLNPSAFGNDNFGVNDVIADPARPSDFYAFTCHQGVWKSTNYGETWTKINTGTNGAELDAGKLWTAAISSDKNRDPNTPPTLLTATGNAAVGVWRSTDGGVSWTKHATNNTVASAGCSNNYYANDLYSLDVDPYDKNHILAGFHGCPGISESTNGGVSWTTVDVVANMGGSIYPSFIDTGNATTTRVTWLSQPQEGTAAESMFRTENGGVTWTNVLNGAQHAHGSWQTYQAQNGALYAPAYTLQGIFRSLDYGKTWDKVSTTQANAVIGTPSALYAMNSYASGGTIPANAQRAAPGAATTWSALTTPNGMTNGAKRIATSFTGTQHVLVSGNWLAGIWRYVQP
jgi:hypothetical protein